MSKRTLIIYLLLAAGLAGVLSWQAVEHVRFKEAARTTLIHRARDITGTVGLVIRSQRRFGGIVSQPRLESALKELVQSEELKSVALFNEAGQVVASAGDPIDFVTLGKLGKSERWNDQAITFINLVDLGSPIPHEGEGARPTIVLPAFEGSGRSRGDDGAGRPRGDRPPLPPFRPQSRTAGQEPNESLETDHRGFRPEPGRPRFGRPFWMQEEEYQALIEKQGLHGFVIVMATEAYHEGARRDLWLRGMIASFSILSVLGLGLAWSSLEKSSRLQLRLVRTSQLNTHLKEMNLAAAGLAHETRNPLNIIRGLAQLISKEENASPEVRDKSQAITAEVDRVTAQLNEFLHYSRPREVRRTTVPLNAVLSDVIRALESDLEDKQIRLERLDQDVQIRADEPLLRQVLFNLLINAIQAISVGGIIQVLTGEEKDAGIFLEIRDDGPGVPPEHRQEIFRPYFTTNHKGTGLGLAVVNQIVLAHGWEIDCRDNSPRGATFRVSRLEAVAHRE
jgi:signal transduction histidine kinase